MPPKDTVIDGCLCHYADGTWYKYNRQELTQMLIKAEAKGRFDAILTFEEFIEELKDTRNRHLGNKYKFELCHKEYEAIEVTNGGTVTMDNGSVTIGVEIGNMKHLIEIGNLTIKRVQQ